MSDLQNNSTEQQPIEFAEVQVKLNAREWDALAQYFEKRQKEAVADAIKETFEEARASTERALENEKKHFLKTNICLPADEETVDLFWEYVEKRLESAHYPETTNKQIIMRMIASVTTHND